MPEAGLDTQSGLTPPGYPSGRSTVRSTCSSRTPGQQDEEGVLGAYFPSRTSSRSMTPVTAPELRPVASAIWLAAFGPRAVRINDPGCVSKTFPDFFQGLRNCDRRVRRRREQLERPHRSAFHPNAIGECAAGINGHSHFTGWRLRSHTGSKVE